MIRRDFAIEIRAPLEKVFAYTTDFRNFVSWQDGVSEASQTPDGPTQSNTTFTLTRTFLGQRLQAAGAVTEFVPNQKCAFETTSGPIAIKLQQSFEPIPGGTRVTIHLEAEPGGFFKLAEAAMDRQLTSAFESQVHKLKSVLEA
jgi:uncharacterized membrane protein